MGAGEESWVAQLVEYVTFTLQSGFHRTAGSLKPPHINAAFSPLRNGETPVETAQRAGVRGGSLHPAGSTRRITGDHLGVMRGVLRDLPVVNLMVECVAVCEHVVRVARPGRRRAV